MPATFRAVARGRASPRCSLHFRDPLGWEREGGREREVDVHNFWSSCPRTRQSSVFFAF